MRPKTEDQCGKCEHSFGIHCIEHGELKQHCHAVQFDGTSRLPCSCEGFLISRMWEPDISEVFDERPRSAQRIPEKQESPEYPKTEEQSVDEDGVAKPNVYVHDDYPFEVGGRGDVGTVR